QGELLLRLPLWRVEGLVLGSAGLDGLYFHQASTVALQSHLDASDYPLPRTNLVDPYRGLVARELHLQVRPATLFLCLRLLVGLKRVELRDQQQGVATSNKALRPGDVSIHVSA